MIRINRVKWLIGMSATVFAAQPSFAEGPICKSTALTISDAVASTPNDRFSVRFAPSAVTPTGKDFVVVDKLTGLMWEACSTGFQESIRETAAGPVLADCQKPSTLGGYDWQGALNKATVVGTYKSYTGWRVPTYKELNSIVERQCIKPSINTPIFPGTRNGPYWSSSPLLPMNGGAADPSAFVVDFYGASKGLGDISLPVEGLFSYTILDTNDPNGREFPTLATGKFGGWLRLVRTCSLTPASGASVDECGLTR